MDITVFGANGRVGRLVVRRVLDRGHQVRAFVRTHDPFEQAARLRVVAGDVADTDAVHDAVQGAEAVDQHLGRLAPRHRTKLVLEGGVVRGTWSVGGGELRVRWFAQQGRPPREALEQEVARLSTLLGRPLSPTVEIE